MSLFDEYINDDEFLKEISPAHERVLEDVRNLPEFAFIKGDLQRIKGYIQELYKLLDQLELYTRPASAYTRHFTEVYNTISRIKEYSQIIDDIFNKVKRDIKEVPNYGRFEGYLEIIQMEIPEKIAGLAGILQHDMSYGYNIAYKLPKFKRVAREKLEELDLFMDSLISHM
ncbi:MAG: hypothetical protein NV1_04 [Nanoarchaeotal virus 1]|nr:MAG: hypothetical protein NV1_04 [Nanoarchaeotal virus 1]